MRWLSLLIVVGCTDPAGGPTHYGYTLSSSTDERPTGFPSETYTDYPGYTYSGDDGLVRELVYGMLPVEQVLPTVAWSDGWPVASTREPGLFDFVFPTEDPGPWYLVGDHDGWTGQMEMLPGPGFVYLLDVPVPSPEGSGYKFAGPSGEIADPWARSYTHDAYGELSYVRPPVDAARIDRWPGISSPGVVPRDLRVYRPPGPGPFPTLYAHDGQNLFDPTAIWGGWRLLDALEGRDISVVAIDNTPDRFEEYTHAPDEYPEGTVLGGNGEAYVALVDDYVRPEMERRYGLPPTNGLLGSSLGGLISLYIAEERPGRYDFVGAMSPTLGWGSFVQANPVMDQLWAGVTPGSVVLYLDSGGDAGVDGLCTDPDGDGYPEDDPDDADNYCMTRQFADQRAADGWTWDADLFHWHAAGAEHDEAAWAARVDLPLEVFEGVN